MKLKKFIPVLMLAMLLTLLAGCGQKSKSGEAEVKAYADTILENILVAANKDDYASYSKDFSDKMKTALTESNFKQQNKLIKDKIGDYVSKEFVKTQPNGEYVVAIYKGRYSSEPKDVMISITFKNGDEAHKVEGLFMTSPKLASK
jgi:outer membrane lipoprotein-sorting protein